MMPQRQGNCPRGMNFLAQRSWRTSGVSQLSRDNGKRSIVRADEMLTAFLKLERVTRQSLRFQNAE